MRWLYIIIVFCMVFLYSCTKENIQQGTPFSTTYTCEKSEGDVSIKFRQDTIMLYVAIPEDSCKNFSYGVRIAESYPTQWFIDITTNKRPDCLGIECKGVHEATLNIPIQNKDEVIGSVSVAMNNRIIKSVNIEDVMCGGIAAFSCPNGYECKLDGDYPDATGKCKRIE